MNLSDVITPHAYASPKSASSTAASAADWPPRASTRFTTIKACWRTQKAATPETLSGDHEAAHNPTHRRAARHLRPGSTEAALAGGHQAGPEDRPNEPLPRHRHGRAVERGLLRNA